MMRSKELELEIPSCLTELSRARRFVREFCCITDPVDSLFKLMGFNQLFGIYESREDAVDAFKASD